MTHPNPVDAVAQVLAAEGAREPQHAACLAIEAIAAALHQRCGGRSDNADWLAAAAMLRCQRG